MARAAIRLLIVEDDEDDFVLASDLLNKAEPFTFDIEWAESPEQARQRFRENRHDLCLMDYRLGAEVGINLVREALSHGFTAPIIMLTGQDDSGVEIAAAQAGAVDYLTKDNLGKEQLLRAIRYALARREIQSERDERMQAEAANKSKTEFLATLSHEIRTPLTSIIGYTELLIHQYHSNAQLVAKLGIINRNGAHLLSLLNDTLDLSKIEAGKLEIDVSTFELGAFISDLAALIQETASAKKLQFAVTAHTPLPASIETDPMRLRQILLNLLGNAIKFTSKGKVELLVSCHANTGEPSLVFQVRDTGIGIGTSQLKNIFDPFTQLKNGSLMGSGLGLTISRKLAEKLGGSIRVESEVGIGSTFTLTVNPGTVDMSNTTLLSSSPQANKLQPRFPHKVEGRILVVDDVEDVRKLIQGMLAVDGIEADTVSSGQQALIRLADSTKTYTAVLMDLNMPGLDGYQTLQQVQNSKRSMPVIALTAASLKGERERCLQAGFAAYLSKPVTASILLATLDKVLQGRPKADLVTSQRILVVEDDEDANAALCMLLELSGHQATGVHSGEAAEAAFKAMPWTLVFCDLNLPDCKGLELLERLHATHGSARLYIISGDSAQAELKAPDFISGFLLKPVNLKQLQEILKKEELKPDMLKPDMLKSEVLKPEI